jgi:hypothetical protein
MVYETGKGSDETLAQPVTWIDYLNIGVSIVLGIFLVWTAIDTLMMMRENADAPLGTPLSTRVDASGENPNGRVRLVKDTSHDSAS